MSKGRIEINAEKCKGCALCTTACPLKLLEMGKTLNSYGNFYPVQTEPDKCTGCTMCAIMCADLCISVFRDRS